MKHLFQSLILIAIVSLFSCQNTEMKNSTSLKDLRSQTYFPDFNENNSGLGKVVNKKDTLKILVEFTDLGEWGGHQEQIYLQRNSENNIIARFIKDSVSSENIKTFFEFSKNSNDTIFYSDIDDSSRVIVLDTVKVLNENEENLINLFLHRVFELYLNQESLYSKDKEEIIYIDAGEYIRISNSNSSLDLNYWNEEESSNTWYGKVRKQIFGEEFKK